MTYGNFWEEVGLGESGETYLIGDDYLLRNQSRFLIESKQDYLAAISASGVPSDVVRHIDNLNSSIGFQPVRTKGAEEAVRGNKGEALFKDYRGVEVLSSYSPLELTDLNWSILSEIDRKEALKPLNKLRLRYVLVFLGIIPLIIVSAYLFSRSITRRLKSLDIAARKVAQGDLDVRIEIGGRDEIASLGRSFDDMRGSLEQLMDRQTKTIDALTASVIPLTSEIGVMVLIGAFDERRIDIVQTTLTEELHKRFHYVVILDVTGVPEFNQMTASGLLKIAKSASLMGSKVLITGIHAEMAKNIASLDLNLDGIITENTLQNGISRAMVIVKSIRK